LRYAPLVWHRKTNSLKWLDAAVGWLPWFFLCTPLCFARRQKPYRPSGYWGLRAFASLSLARSERKQFGFYDNHLDKYSGLTLFSRFAGFCYNQSFISLVEWRCAVD
jgi:hypothetical protein